VGLSQDGGDIMKMKKNEKNNFVQIFSDFDSNYFRAHS
jgi:hypothetical protein